ncbi:unnamed protein product [Schistosoma rodhaini]|uniref:NUC153 domain-containing protein n=1 Tax=Schistosoma rodhaini TaxID=6188 RepID=A0AA85FK16_9TREM|nr:unnamed protein product [Schistosoma rodhaini]
MGMQSISSDKEDKEEAEMDLPVSCSFTDQAKQRENHQKKISKTIIENRIKTKALRKAKRGVRKQTDVCQFSEIEHQEIQYIPLKDKEKSNDYLEEEFNCPGYFNPSDHLQFDEDDGDQPSIPNKSQSLDISASCSPNENELLYSNESDEGYDGSEEHDKKKSKTILFDNVDCFTINSNTLKYKGSDFETRNHKSWKKINRLNGIHVRMLDSANIENTARQTCDSFRKKLLYSSSYSGRYGDVKRVTPSLLKNLSRKKKARAGMR